MRGIKSAIAAVMFTAGAVGALAVAPVAAARPVAPSCSEISATTTQCTTNGSVAITTSPGTIAQPVWPYPYNDAWWGYGSMIGW